MSSDNMTDDTSKLDKLKQQKAKLENRIKEIQNKESSRKRKMETRRKILLGVMLHQMIVDGRIPTPLFDKFLARIDENDRAIFDGYLEQYSTHKP